MADRVADSEDEGSTDQVEWDFFVSYTQADRAWAEWISWELQEAGHRVLVQAWDFVPGSNWTLSMQEGVTRAERTVAVVSRAYLGSVYGRSEWLAAWRADPTGQERKLLPVRVEDCDRPGLLADVVGVDLFGIPEAKARGRLRNMIARAISGHARPTSPPEFPRPAISREARFPGALPQVWEVPARNPNFTGRAADLQQVEQALASGSAGSVGSAVTVTAVHGMGGVGKTTLANEFAHVHATDYDVVWWIAAEQPTAISEGFARLAEELGLQPEQDEVRLARQVHRALREVAGWLLVFDNAETTDGLKPWMPPSLMPPGLPGHVLVTTRRGGFDALGPVIDLDVVSSEEAVALMRKRAPSVDEQVAGEIAEELGRLPLALEQAAAYLARSRKTGAEYLRLLRTHQEAMYGRGEAAHPNKTVEALWELSLTGLASDNAAAAQLLDICAYLAPEPIPLDLFTGHPDQLPDPLAAAAGDELAFGDAVDAIVDYSLAKHTPAGLQLHRLVQGALRIRHRRSPASSPP